MVVPDHSSNREADGPDRQQKWALAADVGQAWWGFILGLLAIVAVVWTLLSQALAYLPVSWLGPVMHWLPAQAVALIVGAVRDALGVYNVVIAGIGVAAPWALLQRTRPSTPNRLRRSLHRAGLLGAGAAIISWTVLVASVAQAGGGFHPLAPGSTLVASWGGPDRTVVVGEAGGTTLHADLYLPDSSFGRPTPVVVYVFGGGFISGDRGPNAYSRYIADHGYAVLNVDYRLSDEREHRWDTAVGDIGCALSWLGANGTSSGLDTSRVGVLGGSAGGNLAVNASYMADDGTLQPTCGDRADIPRIQAVVGAYPVVDPTAGERDSAGGALVGERYVGGTPMQYPQRYAFVDSITHAGSSSPPTLIYTGDSDHLVFSGPISRFVDRARDRGVQVEYHEFPFLDHTLGDNFGLTLGTQVSRALSLRWFDEYLLAPAVKD